MRDQEIRELFRELRPEPPPELLAQLLDIPRRERRRKKLLWGLVPAAGLSAAGILLALLFWPRGEVGLTPEPLMAEPVVVAPEDGEVLLPEEVSVVVYGAEPVVLLDGEPLKPKRSQGAVVFRPDTLEPGFHILVVDAGDRKLRATIYVEEAE